MSKEKCRHFWTVEFVPTEPDRTLCVTSRMQTVPSGDLFYSVLTGSVPLTRLWLRLIFVVGFGFFLTWDLYPCVLEAG